MILKDLNKISTVLVNEIKDLTEKITYEKNVNEEREVKNDQLNENIDSENTKMMVIEGQTEEKIQELASLEKIYKNKQLERSHIEKH